MEDLKPVRKYNKSKRIHQIRSKINTINGKKRCVDHIKFVFATSRYKNLSARKGDSFNIAFLTDNNKFLTFVLHDIDNGLGYKTLKYMREVLHDHTIDNSTEVIFNEVKPTSILSLLFDLIEFCNGNFRNNVDVYKMISTINRFHDYELYPKFKTNHDLFKTMTPGQLENAIVKTFYYLKDNNLCPWATEDRVLELTKDIQKKYKSKVERVVMLQMIGLYYMAVRKHYRNIKNKQAFSKTKLKR